jgi:hypothetical protein
MVDAVIRRPFLPEFAVPRLMLRYLEVKIAHSRKVNSNAPIMGSDDLILSGGALLTHDPRTIAVARVGTASAPRGVFVWLRQ